MMPLWKGATESWGSAETSSGSFSGEALDFYDVEKFIVDEEAFQLQYVIM